MALLQGLHGVIAIILLCGLLFAEEAGVPLPFAPGEITLLAAGLLVASGGLNPFVFVPVAIVACIGGSVVGWSWSRLVGEHGLNAIAARLHREEAFRRVAQRLRARGPRGIAVSRSIIGLRIYTTLVAGAVGVPLRTFLIGAAPATAVWVVLFVVLGAVVGIPVEHFFTSVERLAVQGVILVAIGVGGYVAVRRRPAAAPGALMRVPYWLRVSFAVLLDAGIVASIVAGVLSMARSFAGVNLTDNWADLVVVVAVIIVFYLVITRRAPRGTVGETLFSGDYVRRLRQITPLVHEQAPVAERRSLDAELARTLQALGDERRVRIALLLQERDRTLDEVTALLDEPAVDVLADVSALQRGGAVSVRNHGVAQLFHLEARVSAALQSLSAGQAATAASTGTLPRTAAP